MRASVVVVSYNSAAYIVACLASICADLSADDELIVVDNGSSDGTPALVRARFPQARLIVAANNGYAGGCNRGAQAARGDYLLFLNPDTVLRPGAIDALIAPLAASIGHLRSFEGSSAVGGQQSAVAGKTADCRLPTATVALTTACVVHLRQPELINTCGNTLHYTGLAYCRGAHRPVAEYAVPAEVDAVSGAAFAIRRAVFEQLGGFDQRFFMYVEDTDLSLRARLAGYRCLYVPQAIIEHDYRPAYTPAKAFYLDRNRHLMLLKNLSQATYRRLLPGLLLAELVTWGFLMLKGPRFWGVKLRVYRALWAERGVRRQAAGGRQPHERIIIAGLTYRLEFEQLASRALARLAGALLHPAFLAARLPLGMYPIPGSSASEAHR